MSNGHTPGPWVVVTELRDTDEIICDMLNNGYVAITQGQKLSNWRDDAALISAAPDLLAVAECEEALDMPLKQAVEVLERYGWSHEARFELPAKEFVVRLRRAALAKARGTPC